MKTIFTGLSPNAETDDVLLALSLLFRPWEWKRGNATRDIEKCMASFLGVKHCNAFASGRGSLLALLLSLGFLKGEEVLLQAYTCVAVPDPVLWAGLCPVYVDIEDRTYNMSASDLEKKITPKSKVLIIQHTFGVPANIDALLAVARSRGLFVIEDCAHALGATYHEKNVGTFGDASFFSFGRDKVISSVFGGMVATNDDALSLEIQKQQEAFRMPSYAWIAQQLLHPIITAFIKATYDIVSIGKFVAKVCFHLGITPKTLYAKEKRGGEPRFIRTKLCQGLALLALHQFAKLARLNAHRAKIASLYDASLHATVIEPNVCPVWLRYPVQHKNAAQIRDRAKKEKIIFGDWYASAIAPLDVHYARVGYVVGTCPVAEKVATRTLNFPTDIHVSENDARSILEFFNAG